jgi:hypothetical protein
MNIKVAPTVDVENAVDELRRNAREAAHHG